MPGKVAVLGVVTAAGARGAGLEKAPARLRAAGLLTALESAGCPVVDVGDLEGFPYRDDPGHPQARNTKAAAEALRAVSAGIGRALAEGFPLLLGGDCSFAAGAVAGASRALGQPVGLIFLDADADLNTPDTTPSGYLNGMALSLALGRGPESVCGAAGELPALLPEHAALIGFRALDPGERHAIGYLGLALPAPAVRKLGTPAAAALALDGIENADGPILVHLDVDLLDPGEMPAKDTVTPGEGLSWDEASDLLTALLASPRVIGLEVAEYNPDRDPGWVAGRLNELLCRAITRHLRH